MEQIFKNQKLNVYVRTVKSGEKVLFYANEAAEALGYLRPKKAIQTHVWKVNKTTVGELKMGPNLGPIYESRLRTVLLSEQGLYQLIFNSRLPIAEAFQSWVISEVLPSIRKTGSYTLPDRRSLRYNQMILLNETDLHYAVVRYIMDNHPQAVIIPGLGEYQDTSEKDVMLGRRVIGEVSLISS
jgi:prophage antirepressor-like protein